MHSLPPAAKVRSLFAPEVAKVFADFVTIHIHINSMILKDYMIVDVPESLVFPRKHLTCRAQDGRHGGQAPEKCGFGYSTALLRFWAPNEPPSQNLL